MERCRRCGEVVRESLLRVPNILQNSGRDTLLHLRLAERFQGCLERRLALQEADHKVLTEDRLSMEDSQPGGEGLADVFEGLTAEEFASGVIDSREIEAEVVFQHIGKVSDGVGGPTPWAGFASARFGGLRTHRFLDSSLGRRVDVADSILSEPQNCDTEAEALHVGSRCNLSECAADSLPQGIQALAAHRLALRRDHVLT